MPDRRLLQAAAGLALAILALSAPATGAVQILSPPPGAVLAGPSEFEFRIDDGVSADRIDVYVGGRLIGTARPPGWRFIWVPRQGPVTQTSIVAVAYDGNAVVGRAQLETSDATISDSVDVEEVQVHPVVRDAKGNYVRGLGLEDFRVLDHGRAARITYFSGEPTDLMVALLLDKSSSMLGKMGTLQAGALEFVSRLSDSDRVSLYSFDHGFHVGVERSLDRPEVEGVVHEMTVGGSTSLYDAVILALARIDREAGRKVMILFSDGRDERSFHNLDQAIEAARRANVLVYTIATAEDARFETARDDLTALARQTGGEALFLQDFSELLDAFDQIFEDLRNRYYLTFLPRPGRGGERPIRVEVTRPGRYRVRARQSYQHSGS